MESNHVPMTNEEFKAMIKQMWKDAQKQAQIDLDIKNREASNKMNPLRK